MTLPALPSPSSITTAQIEDYAVAVERFADECDDIAAVTDTKNRWAAITEYIRRSSRDGVNRAEVAMRHLEQRVGLLIKAKREAGEMPANGQHREAFQGWKASDLGLAPRDASEFVAMAEHPEIVAEVIESSSDDAPATRNKVRTAIRDHKQTAAAAPSPAPTRRPPLADSAMRTGADLRRATDRLRAVVSDDRFESNKQQVATQLRGHLQDAVEVCQDLLNRLDHQPEED